MTETESHISQWERSCHFHQHKSQVIHAPLSSAVMDGFETLREKHGGPLRVNSAVRCQQYQQYMRRRGQRAAFTSPHVPWPDPDGTLRGHALDIVRPHGAFNSHLEFAKWAREILGPKFRIGWKKYGTFIHIDNAYDVDTRAMLKMGLQKPRQWTQGVEW